MKTPKLLLLILSALFIMAGCKKTDPDILTPESLAGEWKRIGDADGNEFWTLINTNGTGKIAIFIGVKLAPSFIQFHWKSKGKILTLTDYASGSNIICEITKLTGDELQMNVTYPWDPGNKKQETWLKDNFNAKFSTPHITLTTKRIDNKIYSNIKASDADQPNVWIDLNNNGIKDEGESNVDFKWSRHYTFTTQTITLYGIVTEFWSNANELVTLDVSKNTALTLLYCWKNSLFVLDVSKNTKLTELQCSENSLTELDVSKNTDLDDLSCEENPLTKLDVSKNTKLTKLRCGENPNLKVLDVSKNTALESLTCDKNGLTKLDVSNNTALDWLDCSENGLTKLDVSKNTKLTWLRCKINPDLKALDISKNTALRVLDCEKNGLTELDISKNKALSGLYSSDNEMQVAALHKIIDDLPLRKAEDKAVVLLFNNPGSNSITDEYKKRAKDKLWELN